MAKRTALDLLTEDIRLDPRTAQTLGIYRRTADIYRRTTHALGRHVTVTTRYASANCTVQDHAENAPANQ